MNKSSKPINFATHLNELIRIVSQRHPASKWTQFNCLQCFPWFCLHTAWLLVGTETDLTRVHLLIVNSKWIVAKWFNIMFSVDWNSSCWNDENSCRDKLSRFWCRWLSCRWDHWRHLALATEKFSSESNGAFPWDWINSYNLGLYRRVEKCVHWRLRIDRSAKDLRSSFFVGENVENRSIVAVQNLETGHVLIEHWASSNDDSIDRNRLVECNLQELVQIIRLWRPASAADLSDRFRFYSCKLRFEGVAQNAACRNCRIW